MDEHLYKQATVLGVKYNYVRIEARNGLPTLLLLHGWPSTAFDWRHQIPYFAEKGYGVLAPDMLGFGGTDAPLDVESYAAAKYCAQLVALLDLEGIAKAVAVGHDWGSYAASRLANYYPDRFLAYVFVAIPYVNPDPSGIDVDAVNSIWKQHFGYEGLGYFKFFTAEDENPSTADIMEAHFDSLFSLVHAADGDVWKTDFCPTGKMKEWLLADRVAIPGAYIQPGDQERQRKVLLQKGIAPTLNWYRAAVLNVDRENVLKIPQENYVIELPTLLCVCLHDAVGRPERAQAAMPYLRQCKTKEFDAGHWVPLEQPELLNNAIHEFISASL